MRNVAALISQALPFRNDIMASKSGYSVSRALSVMNSTDNHTCSTSPPDTERGADHEADPKDDKPVENT